MIYFIDNGNGLIKIGYSANVEERMKNFRVGSPGLRLIDTMPGNRGHERALHLLLADHRTEGEWFRDNEHVRAAIEFAVANGIAAVKSRRRSQSATFHDSTIDAMKVADIIMKYRKRASTREAEDAYGLPPCLIEKLKYNTLSSSGYYQLLQAGRAAITDVMRELADDLDFIDDLQRADAAQDNELLNMIRKVDDLQAQLARVKAYGGA